MAFKDIAGNNRVKKILRLALKRNRLPNSMLFCGPEGVGKKQTALVLAKALNCERTRDDACEECSTCRAIQNRNFPDVIEIFPDGQDVKIDQIRFLRQIAFLKPMSGRKRVFIVAEAEKMNAEASNAFLKILEEPPLTSHILLVSHNPLLILPTIKSRCQILNFQPVSKEEIEIILKERGYGEEKAKIIALLVRGNLERALSVEWEDIQKKREEAWNFFSVLIRREESSLFIRKFAFSRRNQIREDLEQVLEMFSSFCRDFVLVKEKSSSGLFLNPDYEIKIRESEKLLSYEQTLKFMEEIDFALLALDRNLNPGLLVSSFYSQTTG